MIKRYLFTILSLSFFSFSFSQKEVNNWYFGGFRGLDFTGGGAPTVITGTAMNTWEGCASISDNCTGEVLFYTNGVKVWNKNHQQMTNGFGLMGGNAGGLTQSSTTQSCIIVPKPGNKNIYYIFTNDCNELNNTGGFRYSIVDMTLNGGLGDVTTKNTLLFAPGTEKVTGVHHSNKIDIWVISHGKLDNKFYAYLVTAAGVSAPVISSVGLNDVYQTGYLKASFDGKRLAMCDYNNLAQNGRAQIFNFDNSTGIVSSPFAITIPVNYYGTEFSPDCKKIYFGKSGTFDQYDITLASEAAILASKENINVQPNYGSAWAMQRASDGKIYVAMGYQSLHVVNSPNLAGAASNVVKRGQSLSNGSPGMGITNFVQSFFEPTMFIPRGGLPTATIIANGECVNKPITFASVSAAITIDSVRWMFGDPASGVLDVSTQTSPSHIYTTAGTYSVTLIRFADCGSDTTYHSLSILPLPEVTINDTSLCFGDPLVLSSNIPGNSFVWQNGSTESFQHITEPGTYWIEVTDDCGTDRDSANVIFEDCDATLFVPNAFLPGISLMNPIFLPKGTNIATYNLKVFDRWGLLLFESNDINTGWDGTYKGKVCQEDVYVWKISYESIASSRENTTGKPTFEKLVGHVTLLK